MSASKMEAIVLQCDQGMGTLVRIYEDVMDEEQLRYLVLIDLGSENGTRRYATDAVDLVMTSLGKMGAPRIDLLVISHQDFDHWSLLPDLLKRIKKDLPATTLGGMYRAGRSWGKKGIVAVKEYENYFKVKAAIAPESYSDYNWEPPHELKSFAGVAFRILATNTPTRNAGDLVRNGSSAVVVVEFAGKKIIVPGDATADTLGFINNIFAMWKKEGFDNPVEPCFMLGVPHHGALRTIADNFTTKNARLDIAGKFAKEVQADRVAASAGYKSKFHHPFKRVLKLLGEYTMMDAPLHNYVVWSDQDKEWQQINTDDKLYTTVTGLVNPERKSWRFTITAAGALKIDPIIHGPATPTEPAPHIARPG